MAKTLPPSKKEPRRAKKASGPAVSAVRESHFAGEDRRRLIAEAAYFRAEQRGFGPGLEWDDWLAAEIEVDALLGDDADCRTA